MNQISLTLIQSVRVVAVGRQLLPGRMVKMRGIIVRALLCVILPASTAWAAQITANMLYLTGTNPGFFTFSVNGLDQQLLCDQFFPNVTTQSYVSRVATLA